MSWQQETLVSERERIIETLESIFLGLSLALEDVEFVYEGDGRWRIEVSSAVSSSLPREVQRDDVSKANERLRKTAQVSK